MMRAKIIGVWSDQIDTGEVEVKHIEGMWHVDLAVIGMSATKEEITTAYIEGIEFDVIPRKGD